jgi:hypothetical protein
MNRLEALPKTGIPAPDGRSFPWGPIVRIHKVGPYEIVEFLVDRSNHSPHQPEALIDHGTTAFHPYIDGRDTSRSYWTLDSALVGAVGYRREGPNGRAATYFDLMTGAKES